MKPYYLSKLPYKQEDLNLITLVNSRFKEGKFYLITLFKECCSLSCVFFH